MLYALSRQTAGCYVLGSCVLLSDESELQGVNSLLILMSLLSCNLASWLDEYDKR